MDNTINWINPNLEVRKSKIHQKGVFTKKKIFKGERVAIFGGDIMSIDEIDDLPENLQDYPMQIEERFVIGSRDQREPEIADYFNHSCDPNCGIRGQIFLTALREIEINEEITFDYAMVVSESQGSDIKFEMECTCGSQNCRKEITENDWKLPDLQARYKGYFSQYLLEKLEVRAPKKDYYYNFMQFHEGEIEPSLNKTIKTLIEATESYIVYLDEDCMVEWSINENYDEIPENFGKISNGIAHLETLSMTLLNTRDIEPFRRLLGEGMARLLDEDEKGAWDILETSKRFLNARSNERARIWYLSSSFGIALIALLTALILWNNEQIIDKRFFEVLVATPFGALGALISIIRRSPAIKLDAAAGPLIHIIEGLARCIVGVAGAFLVALAIKSKIIIGFDTTSDNYILLLIAICIISGASERIVPNLIDKVESSIDVEQPAQKNDTSTENQEEENSPNQ